jgi:hypothetical protein
MRPAAGLRMRRPERQLMADWVTISSLATAGGTLVLALATFSSVRSANRSARVAERSLLAGLRPVLTPSREDDPTERVRFGDGQMVIVPGHGGAIDFGSDAVYFALAVRNGGNGLAVIHGWHVSPREDVTPGEPRPIRNEDPPDEDAFHRQQIDLYIPAGDSGYWLGALRDPKEPGYDEVRAAAKADQAIQIDLMYGDHEGGQRQIARYVVSSWPDADIEGLRAIVVRYWSIDGTDPR